MTMAYAGDGKINKSRARRTVNGQAEIFCRKCETWKPATDEHFYRHNGGILCSPCRACVLSKTDAGGKAKPWIVPCASCGKLIDARNITGMCLECSNKSASEAAKIRQEERRIALAEARNNAIAPELAHLYSGLGELPDPLGIAPAGRGWIYRKDGSRF